MYTTQAVCNPSRTSLLTSRRPDTLRIWDNGDTGGTAMWRIEGGNFTSLPQHFKDEGYIVLGTGKIYHPISMGFPGAFDYDRNYSWSPECLPYRDEFVEPCGSSTVCPLPRGGFTGPAMSWSIFDNVTDDEMAEGQLAINAKRLLSLVADNRKTKKDERPFFTAVGFHRPHIPWHAPRHYYDLYPPGDLPIAKHDCLPENGIGVAYAPSWSYSNPQGTENRCGQCTTCGQCPWWGNRSLWDYFTDLGAMKKSHRYPWDNSSIAAQDQQLIRQAYRAAISFTDRNIGQVTDHLVDLNLYDQTVIALWG